MNKYLVAIVLSILSITSQAAAWIQTEICNTTGRDITLNKPLSSDKPSYVNKNGSTGWYMYEGEEPNYNKLIRIDYKTIPNTNDCFYGTVKITVWDSYWGGARDYMTLCDRYGDCMNGAYSLRFYNDFGAMEAGVVPGYAYYYDGGEDIREPCVPFTKHAKTSCYYKSTINKKNDNGIGDYIYKCFVELF